nr:DUF1580 domain-containing protein [Rhodopirellula sp. UBA1907]
MPVRAAIKQATGLKVHPSTAIRWCLQKNKQGQVLESWLVGQKRLTTVGAVRRYVAANNAQRPINPSPFRSTEHARAIDQLSKEGV